ncbi:MAG: GNAT family N-acetyltransferase [Methylovirgula sp.]|nr:GNAT family N-acetyltransferase [Methylovirgula sp.]
MSSVVEYIPSSHLRRLSLAEEVLGQAFAKVEVHRAAAAIEADWAELEALAPVSVYQTRAFLLPWLETLGAARKITPLFIAAKDRQGRTVALLCLGLQRYRGFRVASFLGGKETNFNLGLFRPGTNFSAADVRALLHAAAAALGPETPDIFVLKNQPFEWGGMRNPLALLPHRASPSFAYATKLAADGESFLAAKLSKDTRKKLRKKENRLAQMDQLTLITGEDPQLARKILDTFFDEKIRRCAEKSIAADFAATAMRAFFDRLSRQRTAAGKPWLELHGLSLGDRIIATYIGAGHHGRFSAMVNSFDCDPLIAKSSPGDLLLTKLVATQCAKGRTSFDLGIGEARYKTTYCDTTVPLFDIVLPLSAKGQILAVKQALCSRIKTSLKKHPRVFALLRRMWLFLEHRGSNVAHPEPQINSVASPKPFPHDLGSKPKLS